MNKKAILFTVLMISYFGIYAQIKNNQEDININAAETLMNSDSKIQIGGYAQIDFNQPIKEKVSSNGKLDVHRLVLLFGYRFNDKTNFITEVEFEHVKEVYVEQAFLNYEILPWLNFRGGLMLVPMGIINEYHEPPTYNGVERPNLDSKIVPSTWREIGTGFTGRFDDASVKYQVYIMNGFNGYDGTGKFRGTDGFRKGRQKGAESFMSSPNLATKIDFYGIPGLKLGASGYFGKSQSTLYNGLDMSNTAAVNRADSSVIGISMLGLDARYRTGGFEARAQFNIANLKNTDSYNAFTGKDLGSRLVGYYIEAGYNLLHNAETSQKLVPFLRYEKYNTHSRTEGNLTKNSAYDRTDITFGIGWWLSNGAVLKADYQAFKNAFDDSSGQFNLGVGIWF